MMADQHVQVFLFSDLSLLDDFPDSRHVSRHRFFHEDVLVLTDSLLKVCRPETRRGSEKNDISQLDGFFVSI